MRIAGLVAAVLAAVACSAPAGACIIAGPSVTYFVDPLKLDLEPGEVVLEARFVRREAYKTPPFFSMYDRIIITGGGGPVTDRLEVVRVVQGRFDSDTVLVPVSGGCGGVVDRPPGGRDTGYVVGYATPPAPDWDDAPAVIARMEIVDEAWNRPNFLPLDPLPQPARPREAFEPSSDPEVLMQQARKARDPYVRKDLFEQATGILRERADRGDTSAMVDMGLAMLERAPVYWSRENGRTRPMAKRQESEWFDRAAALGDARAMMIVAGSHDTKGLPGSREAASQWYRKAAEAGNVCAMGTLAQRYRHGWGVTADKAEALKWYRQAVAGGAIMSPYGYEIEGEPPRDHALPQLQCPAN